MAFVILRVVAWNVSVIPPVEEYPLMENPDSGFSCQSCGRGQGSGLMGSHSLGMVGQRFLCLGMRGLEDQ